MDKYIGAKIVQAEPAYRATGVKPGCKVPGQIMTDETIALVESDGWEVCDREAGYKVRYEDGYESWSPKDIFEKAYRRTDGMNFGLALEAAKMGGKIARAGWNGKGMYVFVADDIEFHTDADLSDMQDKNFEVMRCFVMRNAQGDMVPGWLASQTDMLADDWVIVG